MKRTGRAVNANEKSSRAFQSWHRAIGPAKKHGQLLEALWLEQAEPGSSDLGGWDEISVALAGITSS